ncbi:Peptidoglycan-N-acetylglucosamine deacetylase [Lactococcus lactis]|nr:Peptidoglycan-N-acetylglucosamine deacetylase [Lactococcus lactis]
MRKDKSSLNQSITQLLAYLTDIDKVSQLVAKEHQNITEDTIKEAEQALELLNASYEKTDKEKFAQQIATDKQVLVERQKEAERIADEKNQYANKKLIALTFDDGPNPNTTPQLLKTLVLQKFPLPFLLWVKRLSSIPILLKKKLIEEMKSLRIHGIIKIW